MILRRAIAHLRKQEWTAVFIDLAMVVVGILLAFQITEWNEERRERLRERAYLERIVAELDRSLVAIGHSARISREREELGRWLIDTVAAPDKVQAEPGRFIEAIVFAGYTYSPEIRAHTFEAIKSAGELDLFRDQALVFDLTEFYTDVQGVAQWNYLRETKQTEFLRRSAGILDYAQLSLVVSRGDTSQVSAADAMAAHARMLERPAFIEWLPTMVERSHETGLYDEWRVTATGLRARLRASLVDGAAKTAKEAGP